MQYTITNGTKYIQDSQWNHCDRPGLAKVYATFDEALEQAKIISETTQEYWVPRPLADKPKVVKLNNKEVTKEVKKTRSTKSSKYTIKELRQQVYAHWSKDKVREFGDLRRKKTFEKALAALNSKSETVAIVLSEPGLLAEVA